MKSFLIFLIAFLLLNGKSVVAFSQVQDSTKSKGSELSFGVDAGFSNKYMWRGMCYNQGLVFQPNVYVSYGNLSLSSWSNISLWDINSEKNNEVDFTLTYSISALNFDIESSLNYYYYLNYPDVNSSEFFIRLGYPLGDFNLFTGFYVDILNNPGAIYDELGMEYEKELSEKWTVAGSLFTGMANLKFNSYYLNNDESHTELNKSAFNLVSANAYLSYSPIEDFSINGHFQFNQTLDKELTQSLLKANSNYFEIILTKEF
jgi:hypothetical protein